MTRALLAALALSATTAPLAAQTLSTASAVRRFQGESDLAVHVRFGIGEFTLGREAGPALYRGNLVFDERFFQAVNRYDPEAARLEIGTRTRGDLDDIDVDGQRLDLRLTPNIPVTLDFEFGAGKADLDLGGLRLARASLVTGASESTLDFSRPTTHACDELVVKVGAADFTATRLGNANCASLEVSGAAGSLTLDFTGEWQVRDVAADIKLGLGGLTLRFPPDLGVAISLDRFLASFDDEGFVERDGRYVTANLEEAPARLNIDLRAIVGDVSVEWVR